MFTQHLFKERHSVYCIVLYLNIYIAPLKARWNTSGAISSRKAERFSEEIKTERLEESKVWWEDGEERLEERKVWREDGEDNHGSVLSVVH